MHATYSLFKTNVSLLSVYKMQMCSADFCLISTQLNGCFAIFNGILIKLVIECEVFYV